MEKIFMNTSNSGTNIFDEFLYNFTDKLNLKNPNKNIALAYLSIYYTWKNIKSAYNNNKFKTSAPTWDETFNLTDGSYSVDAIQNYFEYIIKKHETVENPSQILIYVNKIKNRTPSKAELSITDCKLYVPVVTLKSVDENKLLNQLKTGFKRTIEWNKCRSQMSNQPVDNNLNYLIDPTFTNVNRLFVLAYENEDDRRSYSKHYTPTVQIKDYSVLVNRKAFFELSVKSMTETYEKTTDLGNNDYYTTGNLLDCEYFKEHYKLIAIDLSKEKESENNDVIQ